jgi:hypothetical protein
MTPRTITDPPRDADGATDRLTVALEAKLSNLAALRRRAIEGGSYRVVVSLTRTVLWMLSLDIFDRAYAQATAGSTDEHTYVAPDLFTAETPGHISRDDRSGSAVAEARCVLVPRGSSRPEWLDMPRSDRSGLTY